MNNHYILGIRIKSKRNNANEWVFVRHRFQTNQTSEKTIIGQFISSNWYSKTFPINKKIRYLILGINKDFSYSNITETINDIWLTNKTTEISDRESSLGINFKEYYTITPDKLDMYFAQHADLQTRTNTGFFELHIKRKASNSELTFRSRINRNVVYLTLPTLIINPRTETLPDRDE